MPAKKKTVAAKKPQARLPKVLVLETSGGQKIIPRDRSFAIEIEDGNGNAIKLEPGGVTIISAAKVTIRASEMKLSAGTLTIDAALSKFSGAIQCDTLVTNSVVSASYSPGVGNIW